MKRLLAVTINGVKREDAEPDILLLVDCLREDRRPTGQERL